jgi:mono/diheme cytochrome c family protein
MLRSIAELAVYGAVAALLTAASLAPETGRPASSATTGNGAGEDRTAVIASDRGALLFATKGCIGCHTHEAFPNARMQFGPDLTGLPERAATRVAGIDAAAYVRQSLREPETYRVSGGYTTVMPDLDLTDEQIESLTAFLLSSTR